jgi:peptide-methionine (R)-S-oxide reductase
MSQNKLNKFPVNKNLEEWRIVLDDKTFEVTRMHKTEEPFTGSYYYNKDKGIYLCSNCKQPIFDSTTKFDSGSGWPSFYDAIPGTVGFQEDKSFGMKRIEVHCNNCGAHLGHVFPDGPNENGGKRFCINSVSIDFKKQN